jgi:hypothetical protein
MIADTGLATPGYAASYSGQLSIFARAAEATLAAS